MRGLCFGLAPPRHTGTKIFCGYHERSPPRRWPSTRIPCCVEGHRRVKGPTGQTRAMSLRRTLLTRALLSAPGLSDEQRSQAVMSAARDLVDDGRPDQAEDLVRSSLPRIGSPEARAELLKDVAAETLG